MSRCLELLIVWISAPVWLPLMGVVALIVRWQIGSPVLFHQPRPGYKGRVFTLTKFRTMRSGGGSDDERLTRAGRFLRACSLDELPELFHVIRGEMALVGPRPLLVGYLPLYSPEQTRRHDVRPGITGWAQVNGRNAISWQQKFAYDVDYVQRRSTWFDLVILVKTVLKVFTRDGTCATGPFLGNDKDV